MIEQFHGFAIQWQHANLFALARDPDLRIRKLDVLAVECKTSHDRKPCSNIRPTMAKSREVRKLDQKRATSSTDSGTIKRLGVFTRNWSAPGVAAHSQAVIAASTSSESRAQTEARLRETHAAWHARPFLLDG